MSKRRALTAAKNRQDALNLAEQRATEAASERDQAVYEAQTQGATYSEIQEATGLSTARVTQILRRARTLATTTTD